MSPASLFLKCHPRKKDGKDNRYWSICENRRTQDGQRFQRQVIYLGEINDSQKASWIKQIQVFDTASQAYATMALFVEDPTVPSSVAPAVQIRLGNLRSAVPVSGERAGWPCGCGSFSSWMSSGPRIWSRAGKVPNGD